MLSLLLTPNIQGDLFVALGKEMYFERIQKIPPGLSGETTEMNGEMKINAWKQSRIFIFSVV